MRTSAVADEELESHETFGHLGENESGHIGTLSFYVEVSKLIYIILYLINSHGNNEHWCSIRRDVG